MSRSCEGYSGLHGSMSLFGTLLSELQEGLELFWRTAGEILSGGGVRLADARAEDFALERNFFSALFLYSYARAGISGSHRVLYVAVNQCLRGMVTGCDNLLDTEYKVTLETDLPAGAHTFRSVLDIMVADRVLFAVLARFGAAHGWPPEAVIDATRASLTALTRSGAQEASEENGVDTRWTPEAILERVHHFKTGLLFLCPWAIPAIIEPDLNATELSSALYDIGMGCQVMDDAVDLLRDITGRRHNYVASLIAHGADEGARHWLREPYPGTSQSFYAEFPDLLAIAGRTAWGYLDKGLSALLAPEHRAFAAPAGRFIAGRIGFEALTAGGTR